MIKRPEDYGCPPDFHGSATMKEKGCTCPSTMFLIDIGVWTEYIRYSCPLNDRLPDPIAVNVQGEGGGDTA